MEPILSMRNVVAGYGAIRILHDVSFEVAAGSITALIGGNGAGKTTIMRSLSGMIPLEAGTVAFDGRDISRTAPSARVDMGLALVPEGRLVFPKLSVEDNLRLGAIAPRARAGHAERRDEVYALFPRLAERHRQAAGTLSGGEQQMLALGRGLMARPRLLLLDEPSLGLAPLMAQFLFDTVAALRRQGITILISEQDVPRTLQLADRAYVVENGRITLDGGGRELLEDSRVREAYLGI